VIKPDLETAIRALRLAVEMRKAQSRYFNLKPGTVRRLALGQAKRLEREFDIAADRLLGAHDADAP
jgi:hypothetical protein